MKSFATFALAGALLAAPAAFAASDAQYNVTFEGTWTAANHALEYPSTAHFSGLIGATHDARYVLFRDGGKATDGLERLAETGAHSPLDQEIRAAKDEGAVGALLTSASLWNLPNSVSISFTIDEKHPMVSLVAMIAPSPDWFGGVADVNLLENGRWVARKELTIYAWDAGTDSGTTYKADDIDTQPHAPISTNRSLHFMKGDKAIPVGKLVFEKTNEMAPQASIN